MIGHLRITRRRKALLVLVAVMITAVFLFPVYWMVITSFKEPGEIFAYPPTFFPKSFSLRGYVYQLRTSSQLPLEGYLLNSVIIGALTMVTTVICSGLSAYGLAKFQLRIGKFVFLGFLIAQMLPVVVFLAPLFILFRQIRLLDTYMAPVVFAAIHSVPFCVLILRPYFLAIPGHIEEAARLDGCSALGVFFRIVVPIALPGMAVVTAFSFIIGWGDLMGPLTFLRNEKLFPLTVTMFKAVSEYGVDWNMLMAFGVVLSTPILVVFLLLQKYIVFGLTDGALKG